ALKGVFRMAKDEALRHKANQKLGEIYLAEGDKEKAYAAFQRVAMLA
ncbi:MAG: hypothetical protein GWN87_06200, partial [Desulfuromonadales bacterium]|nr:hypothetical protein [Desulfuromonadales bacterium]